MNGVRSESVVKPGANVALVFPCGTVGFTVVFSDALFFTFDRISAASSASPMANASLASSSHEVSDNEWVGGR